MVKKIYYFDPTVLNDEGVPFDEAHLPPVEIIENRLRDENGTRVLLRHGDIVNFSDYRYVSAYFVRECTQPRLGQTRDWVRNPDVSGSGYLTVPKEITYVMDDAIMEYSEIMNKLDDDFTAIYLAPEDVYLESYPEPRTVAEHKWYHKGVEVIEGRERQMSHLLIFTNEEGPVLHIEAQKSYRMTKVDQNDD
jgi:hypothetical protein